MDNGLNTSDGNMGNTRGNGFSFKTQANVTNTQFLNSTTNKNTQSNFN